MKRIVLAYSGGFATSVAIPWLAQHHDAEVITVTLDVGQERELAAVRERALALGAARAHVIDAREEFVRSYVRPALEAGAFGVARALLPSALALPLIAKRLIEIARMEAATVVAHCGDPGSANEVALHAAATSINPAIEVLAVPRVWGMNEDEAIAFARARHITVPPAERLWTDANVWGRVVHAATGPAPEDAFTLTRPAALAPEHPAFVDIEFAAGVPVRANGVEMPLIEMIESLETIAGAHGVGRTTIESDTDGTSVIETPAGFVLAAAHRELEAAVLGNDLATMKNQLARIYAGVIASGRWFSPIREAIDAFAHVVQPRVTGTVRVRLHKGDCVVVERKSDHAVEPSATPQAVA